MSRTTAFRRGASALGASGLIALSLAGPAVARPDPGPGDLSRCTTGCHEGGTTGSGPTLPRPDEGTVEYLQLGAGVLAGIALAGAGMAVASRRSHAHAAHPA